MLDQIDASGRPLRETLSRWIVRVLEHSYDSLEESGYIRTRTIHCLINRYYAVEIPELCELLESLEKENKITRLAPEHDNEKPKHTRWVSCK